TPGMLPLPEPTRDPDALTRFKGILNIKSDEDWVLYLSWLLSSLRPTGEKPILFIHGCKGTAKSTATLITKNILDQGAAPLQKLPEDEREVMIASKNSWCLCYDNISFISKKTADSLCRLSTGAGLRTRKLFTNDEEEIFQAIRPIIINGINNCVDRSDLADRVVVIELNPITDEQRRPTGNVMAEFNAVWPGVLGCLLDAVAMSLKNYATTELSKLPRMAEYALWSVASEPVLWEGGKFLSVYEANRKETTYNLSSTSFFN
ncbi:MAG: hypothetical protein HQK56_01145, partial [Deltaproteobacteria bacterium]|nr:hypothetical protein [Deltaproteobacteria bacterium]